MNFSEIFSTDSSKNRLIEIYHQFKDKTNLYDRFLSKIKEEFGVDINRTDKERFRSWFKRIRKQMDEQYAVQELTDIREERIRLRDQRREYNKLIREKARFDYIQEYIQESAKIVSKEKPIQWNNHLASIISINDKEGVLVISDWHYGLEYENIFGVYNVEICKQRVRKLTQKVIEYGLVNKICKLHVFNLGDMISGNIHVTTRIANTEDVIDQTIGVAEIISQMIGKLAEIFPEVIYYDVLDNHSRVSMNKNEAIPQETFGRFITWWMEERLRLAPNIKFVNSRDHEIAVADVCNNTIFAVHGHRDNLKNIISNLTLMLKKIPNYVLVGHHHHNEEDEVHGCEILVSPSLCGADEYAKSIRKSSKPSQRFYVFNEKGREITYHITF